MPIPTAKQVRLTATDDPHGTGVPCKWCTHPRFAGDHMFAVEARDGRELYCSTTCKTFMYGSNPNPRRR